MKDSRRTDRVLEAKMVTNMYQQRHDGRAGQESQKVLVCFHTIFHEGIEASGRQ